MFHKFPFSVLVPKVSLGVKATARDLPPGVRTGCFKLFVLIMGGVLVLGLAISSLFSSQQMPPDTTVNPEGVPITYSGQEIVADGKPHAIEYWFVPIAVISVSNAHRGMLVGKNGWRVSFKVSGSTDTYTLQKDENIMHVWDTHLDSDHDKISYG